MSLHDAVDLRETETGALLPFGGEKRLERALAHLGRHADAGVDHLELHRVSRHRGLDAEGPACLHRVERVLHEVEQRFAELAGDTTHQRAAGELPLELDLATAGALRPER